MITAVFGRTIDRANLPELIDVLRMIKSSPSAKPIVYAPFYQYLKEVLQEDILGNCALFEAPSELPKETALFFSLGGDGTFLSSVPLVGDKNIPIVGINFGRLGFLTTAASGSIASLLEGNFTTESRNLLTMESSAMPEGFYPYALNEFSIQREGPAVLELGIKVDGVAIPPYMADGVLVATATGSTAYSMSAGGPIVMPGCKVLIIVPVAPHNLNIRPLVVAASSTIEVSFTTRYNHATLSADNRSFFLPNGAAVKITSSERQVSIVKSGSGFIDALSRKLYWGADWRNSK